jgi:hypothetical protein
MKDLINSVEQELIKIREKLSKNQELEKEDFLYLYLASALEEDAK